ARATAARGRLPPTSDPRPSPCARPTGRSRTRAEEIQQARRPEGAATGRDMDEPTLSVTELNTTIRDALRGAIPENVWVRGEVQGLRESGAGHVYFQLVEKDERRNRVQAALDVALFRSHLMTVHAALRTTPGVELADDGEV